MAMQSQPRYGNVSRWYLFNEMEQFFADVEPGDAVEFQRLSSSGINMYNHWGIYVGKVLAGDKETHCVVHISNPAKANSMNVIVSQKHTNNLGIAVLQSVIDCAQGCNLRINNSMDNRHSPHSREEIVRRAFAAIQEYDEYDLLYNNCEHFVNWCRNGVRKSCQVEGFFEKASEAVGIFGKFVFSRFLGRTLKY